MNEGLVAIEDKDLYSRTQPSVDRELFRSTPNGQSWPSVSTSLVFEPDIPGIETGRQTSREFTSLI